MTRVRRVAGSQTGGHTPPVETRAPANVVIRASAGTGKTFQLSNRYLALLNAGVAAEHILATTFTRKAAGEIFERILLRLAYAAADESACAELGAFLGDPGLTPGRCAALLARLTRELHRVRVGTLDSFFSQIATSFSLELGLPPGWDIIDDLADAQLRRQAIDDVLSQGSPHDVSRLMHLLSKGNAQRSVSGLIEQAVKSLYGVFQETPPEAWRRFPSLPLLSSEQLAKAVQALEAAPLPGDRRIVPAHAEACRLAALADWEAFIQNGLVKGILADRLTYYGKPLPAELVAAYQRVIAHARALLVRILAEQTAATYELLARFDVHYRRRKHAARAMRFDDVTRALGRPELPRDGDRLAFRLDGRIAHVLLDEFQDTSLQQWDVLQPLAQRLAAHAEHAAPTAEARQGDAGRRHALPADETGRGSGAPALEPGSGKLASACGPSAFPGASVFCVGDAKQAIYGWRGGVAEIFDALVEQLPGMREQQLNRSFRSAPPIIDTVNRLFTNLSRHPSLGELAPAVARWSRAFQPHSTAREKLPGYACLQTAPRVADKGRGGQSGLTLAYAAERIKAIAEQARGRSLGVLARRNRVVAQLIFELRRRGVAASDEGGNALIDSAGVQLVLSLLRLADHPGDTAARFHVARSPLGRRLNFTNHADDRAADALAEQVRRLVVAAGYGPAVEGWARELAPSCNRRELRRLEQLVGLAYTYQPHATLRTSDFVKHVEHQPVPDPTGDRVRVMTVHQAKGLEFDIVVLPELDGRLLGQSDACVVGRPAPTAPIDRVCLYRNRQMQELLPPELRQAYADSAERDVIEALCVLYVSVTRPVHALHMIVAPSAQNERTLPKTSAGLLRAALADGGPADPEAILFETGDPQWYARRDDRDAGPPAKRATGASRESRTRTTNSAADLESRTRDADPAGSTPLVVRLADMSGGRTRGLERTTPSRRAGAARVRLSQVLRVGRADALLRGSIWHAWFEQIRWLDELPGRPDEQRLRGIAAEIDPMGSLDVERLLVEFDAMLRAPPIAEALSQRSYLPPHDLPLPPRLLAELACGPIRCEVSSERRIAVRDGNTVVAGSIDRLVLLYRKSSLLAADVLDFKTDFLPEEDSQALAEKVEFYRGQLETYRPAVARMYRLPLASVSARLLLVGAGIVQNV